MPAFAQSIGSVGRAQTAQACPADGEAVAVAADLGSESRDRARRRERVRRTTPKPAISALAVRDRADQESPVGDRLVPGNGEVAPQRRGRSYLHPHHPALSGTTSPATRTRQGLAVGTRYSPTTGATITE